MPQAKNLNRMLIYNDCCMPRTEPGSVLLWTREVEDTFVDLLVATFRQYNSLSWKSKDWNDIAMNLYKDHNFIASLDKLQHKFQRMKSTYKKFEHLLNHTGVGWDPLLATVTCPEDVRMKFMEKRGYAVLLQQGFPHYEKLHEILRGRLATGAMSMQSSNPPTPAQLHAMEQNYIANQTSRRAGKQPVFETLQESEGSSDSPPPSAHLRQATENTMNQNRRRKASALQSDPIIIEAMDMIRTLTSTMSPSGTGASKKSKSVSSPQKSDTATCHDLATTLQEDLTTDEYVELMLLLRDDYNRKTFLTLNRTPGPAKFEVLKKWIKKSSHT